MKLKASKMLEVVSVLLIIFGGFGIMAGLFNLIGIPKLVDMGLNPVIGWGNALLALVKTILWLVAGILGVASFKKVEKVNTIFALALVVIILSLLSAIVSIICVGPETQASLAYSAQVLEDVGMGDSASMVSSVATGTTMITAGITAFVGLILPILYLYASIQNKSSVDGVQEA